MSKLELFSAAHNDLHGNLPSLHAAKDTLEVVLLNHNHFKGPVGALFGQTPDRDPAEASKLKKLVLQVTKYFLVDRYHERYLPVPTTP